MELIQTVPSGDALGESPCWDDQLQVLYWVDICRKQIKRYNPARNEVTIRQTDEFPVAVALTQKDGRLLIAFPQSVCMFDFESGRQEALLDIERDYPENRLNDCKCDAFGNFWVSSMKNNLNPDGSEKNIDEFSGTLYRISPDCSVKQMEKREFGISNTLAWDLERGVFYFGDSMRNSIFAYDFDSRTQSIGGRRLFAKIEGCGVPDGSTIDADGNLWNSRFFGACVLKINPSGAVTDKVDLPATNITSCIFGGKQNNLLFITTGNAIAPKDNTRRKNEGDLLILSTNSQGLPPTRFGA